MKEADTKLIADHLVHAQAVKLSRDGWRVVLSLPLVCEELSEECPEWAWRLCEHVAAVADGSPVALLEVLARAVGMEGGEPIAVELAQLGASLDLCEVLDPTDREARIRPTSFGDAVAMFHARAPAE